jgi:aspartyl aminopeptidase
VLDITSESKTYSRQMMDFIDASPSPFHAVDTTKDKLEKHGYHPLDEKESWSLQTGQKYYVERGGGSLIAFIMGTADPVDCGARLVGAHTDSPNIRLKPHLAKVSQRHLLFDVEPYGGLLIATWSDRDLSLAGRVIIKTAHGFSSRLIRSPQAICRIPNLAIHMNRKVNDEGLVLNKHKHLSPILSPWSDNQEAGITYVKEWLAQLAECDAAQIMGHDLCLFDDQPAAFSGLNDDYLQCGRLDNLASSYHGLSALLAQNTDCPHVRLLSLFDHEEVGSRSARGADSTFLGDVLLRIAGGSPIDMTRMIQKSHQVSADMAHAVHPHYADLHDGTHQPWMNHGPVIKNNVNTRYATDGSTAAVFRQVCQEQEIPVQEFVNRADLACGSTIGSITAARLGLPTVDVGNPMWSMHSIREMTGTADQIQMHKALTHFYLIDL